MWVPLLLVGAAVAGILIAKKYSESEDAEGLPGPPPDTPDVPGPPPGVINMSWNSAKSFEGGAPEELIWVGYQATNADQPDRGAGNIFRFTSTENASLYYDTMLRFFDKNHGFWTCPTGFVDLRMFGFSKDNPNPLMPQLMGHEQFECDESMANKAGLEVDSLPKPLQAGKQKPLYVVLLNVFGSTVMQESFVFGTDAEAELYYRLLKAFFDQQLIRQAYTFPVGTIVLSKYGAMPSKRRVTAYDQDGQIMGSEPA